MPSSRGLETHTDEFKQLNPRHKIPVLRHGSLVVTESAAIIQYLSETFPNSTQVYVPNDAVVGLDCTSGATSSCLEFDAGSLYVIRRHDGLKQIYGEAPTAVAAAKSYFLHNVDAMAARIGSDGSHLFGEKLSAADILLMTCLDWAASCDISLPETVSSYRQRGCAAPGGRAAL